MTPSQAFELIQRSNPQRIDETTALLTCVCQIASAEDQTCWSDLTKANTHWVSAKLKEIGNDDEFEPSRMPEVGEEFNLVIVKNLHDNILDIFFPTEIFSRNEEFHDENFDRFRLVRVAGIEEKGAFSTKNAFYRSWIEGAEPVLRQQDDPLPNPKGFVRDYSAKAILPLDLRTWIVDKYPENTKSAFFQVWMRRSFSELLSSLVNRLDWSGEEVKYYLDGPPSVEFHIDDAEGKRLQAYFNEAAEWVFGNASRDAEARHELFSHELAREYRSDEFASLDSQCLRSAQAAYRAYIKHKSSDAIEALAKLRVSVIEETQKISDRGHELAKSMWRDIAVAGTPLILRLLSNSTDAGDISKKLAYVAAAFLAVSILSQWFLNERWLWSQGKAREVWKTKLHIAITKQELGEIADTPIARSKFDYRVVAISVSLIYLGMIVILWRYASGAIQIG